MKILNSGYIMNLKGRLGYFAWPSITKLEDDSFVCVASGYRMAHICPFGRVVASYSKDGIKWTPPGVILDTSLDNRDSGLLSLNNGKYLLSTFTSKRELLNYAVPYMHIKDNLRSLVKEYINLMDEDAYEKYQGSLVSLSEDGINFSAPKKVEVSSPHGPIQLKNGKILYIGTPIHPKDKDTQLKKIFSEDGINWSESENISSIEDGGVLCEPFAVEAEDNHIILMSRWEANEHDEEGVCLKPLELCQSDSYDGGKTFSLPKHIGVIGAPPHMVKCKNGDIILTYGRREKPYGIRGRVSKDNGKTWGKEFVLDDKMETFDFGYPCSVEMEDGNILTVYYYNQNKGENASIKYVIWSLI